MTTDRTQHEAAWLLSLGTALGLALLVLWWLRPMMVPFEYNTGHDFRLLYAASWALRDHQNPYDPTTLLRYAVMTGLQASSLSAGNQLNQPYVYPPLFAWLAIPVTYLSPLGALAVWRVVSVAAVLGGTYGLTTPWRDMIALFATRWRRLLVAAIVMATPVAVYGLYWGNPVMLVYGAMGARVWALSRDQQRWDVAAGALMSLALLKFQLALPLAALAALAAFCLIRGEGAWARRRRVAYGFASACAGWLALDVLATGPALLLAWPRSILDLSRVVYMQPDMPSLLGLIQPTLQGLSSSTYSLVSLAIAGLTALVVIGLYVRLHRNVPPAVLLAVLTVVWCFGGAPYGHANDEILLLPGGFALAVTLGAGGQRWVRWRRTPISSLADLAAGVRLLAGVIFALPALGLLHIGVLLELAYYQGHMLPRNLAGFVPLVLLIALGLALLTLAETHCTIEKRLQQLYVWETAE